MTLRKARKMSSTKDLGALTDLEFYDLYEKVWAKAKECLIEANKTCGDNWPRGQAWSQLGGTSKSTFLQEARESMGIDREAFLKRLQEVDGTTYDRICRLWDHMEHES